jgi:hypothetical protein
VVRSGSIKKGVLGILLGGLLVLGALAATKTTSGYACTLTGKHIEKCCCVEQKDGKLYCTLASKTVDSCCCKAEK